MSNFAVMDDRSSSWWNGKSAGPIAAMLALGLGLAMRGAAETPDLWIVLVGSALAQFVLIVWLVRTGRTPSMAVVIGVALALRLLFLTLPPVLSDDLYRYAWDGLVSAEGISPYAETPGDLAEAIPAGEALLSEMNSPAYYSVYPPVSQIIFHAAARAAGGDAYATIWWIKILVALLEAAALLLLAWIGGARAALLYGWHPLSVIEVAGQAHGEGLLVLFVVLLLLAERRRSTVLSSIALIGAIWTKLYPVLLLPLYALRRQWRTLAFVAAGSALLWSVFWTEGILAHLWSSLRLYTKLFEFNAGPYAVLKEVLWWTTGSDPSKWLGPLLQYTFLAITGSIIWYAVRTGRSAGWTLLWISGSYFALATTVHPWYLLPLVLLSAARNEPVWAWQWLGALSVGSYLFYMEGPAWLFSLAGWGGALVIAMLQYGPRLLDRILRRRARWKADLVEPLISRPGGQLLDLGAGEGFVALELVRRHPDRSAHLVDVVESNRTQLTATIYDGRTLPFADDAFDCVLLVFALHHAEDPTALLAEAARVARHEVIVLESTFHSRSERAMLTALDRLANALRGEGRMRNQPLHFKRPDQWTKIAGQFGTVDTCTQHGRPPHRILRMRLQPAPAARPAHGRSVPRRER